MDKIPWISKKDFNNAVGYMLSSVNKARTEASKRLIKNVIDPFTALMLAATSDINDPKDLLGHQAMASAIRGIPQAVGKFHQNILGSVSGWEDHDAGYDLENVSRRMLAEVKNKHNTMNASNRDKVIQDLDVAVRQKQTRNRWTGYLVIIVPKSKERYEKDISLSSSRTLVEIDGASFYALATGHQDALRNLYDVLVDQLIDHPDIDDQIRDRCRMIFSDTFA